MSTNDTFITSFNKSNIFEFLNKVGDGSSNLKGVQYTSFMSSFNYFNISDTVNIKKPGSKKKKKEQKLFDFNEESIVKNVTVFYFNETCKKSKIKAVQKSSAVRRKNKKKVKELYHYSRLKYFFFINFLVY